MFDIGWDELLIIAIVALVVIGPKDLPHAFRIAGRWMARARTMAREFQSHVDELMRESELDDLKREISDVPRPQIMDEIDSELMSGQLPSKPLSPDSLKPVVTGAAPAAAGVVVSPAAVQGLAADATSEPVIVSVPEPATSETDPPRAA
jgi:sec-independent protein translocase protein TatB